MSNVAQSPGYSPYMASTPTNNGPVVQTFRSGDYQFENSCDCYCCPCSCPGTEYSTTDSANDNSQCDCGRDTQAACACRRSDVRNTKTKLI
jgi:hypothetical protein